MSTEKVGASEGVFIYPYKTLMFEFEKADMRRDFMTMKEMIEEATEDLKTSYWRHVESSAFLLQFLCYLNPENEDPEEQQQARVWLFDGFKEYMEETYGHKFYQEHMENKIKLAREEEEISEEEAENMSDAVANQRGIHAHIYLVNSLEAVYKANRIRILHAACGWVGKGSICHEMFRQ